MRFPLLHTPEELTALVAEVGFLPFFANRIPGFSIEECCAPELWFTQGVDGPWEWKGPAVRSGKCVYGKLYGGRAGYVSLDWFPDLSNYRRDGYDFDARYDDGLASRKDKELYDAVASRGAVLSRELKALCGCRAGGGKGFETVLTRLQAQTYISVADFVYMRDKSGRPYGWGVAKYAAPEALYGYDAVRAAYCRPPEESKARIMAHLTRLLPGVSERELLRVVG